MELKDLKIIVTGAARGMGAHFVHRLVESGAQVVAGDVDLDGLERLPSGARKRRLDVRDEQDCEEFVQWAAGELGGLNALVNNAGIIRDGLLVKKDRKSGELRMLGTDDWRAVIDVNLTGAMLMTRAAVAQMVRTEQRPGIVVGISSISRHGNRGQSNYVATKAALAANTVTWAREFAPLGIRVGAIAPGMVETPMTRGMHQKARDALVTAIPVGRIGEPEDIWQGLRFIIECDYFNGRVLDVDGGLTMA